MSIPARLRRGRAIGLIGGASAVLAVAAAVLVPAGGASAATTISVDFSTNLGAPTYRASGTLYGMTEDGANPPDQYYRNIKWHFERAGGAQLPGGGWVGGGYTRRWNSVLAQAKRTAALGGTFIILPHDLWGADGAGISTWPGDNGDWTNFDNFLNQVISDVRANNLTVQWDIWNEPDLTIFWNRAQSQYLAMWARAYQRIRAAFPNAVIVGPSSAGKPSSGNGWWTTYLDYVKANNVVPNIFSWHDEPGDPVSETSAADSLLSARGITRGTPYQINEYATLDRQNPGGGGWFIGRLERARADGLRGNWGSGSGLHNFAAGLLTGSTGAYQTKGEWYTYNFYASMTGTLANLTPTGGMDGVATKDNTAGNAKVLLGSNGVADTVTLALNRLDTTSVVRNGQVRVVVQRVPYNGGGAVSGPVTVSDQTVNVASNSAAVTINWTSAQDGYTVTVLPPAGASPPPTTAPPTTAPPTTAPPTTAPPTTAPPTTAPPGSGCGATYQIANSWPGGFQGTVTVTNHGTTATNGWTVRWTFPNGQTISQLWNGSYTQSGANVTVTNASYNGTVAPGQSTTFGFIGTSTGTNTAPSTVICN